MNIESRKVYGHWTQYTLTNDHGMIVSFLDYGGILTEIRVPDREGNFENIVLQYENMVNYETDPFFLGAIIGRVAGRIKGAGFSLDGDIYDLERNDGANHLHGGSGGFHKVIWEARPFEKQGAVGVELRYVSEEETCGYPGKVEALVTYTLNNANELILHYKATTDKTTPFTLTNHSYFNLSGNMKDTVDQHQITMNSDRFLELDHHLIPTGKVLAVGDCPFDFRKGRKVEDGIKSKLYQNEVAGNGYDHYFLFEDREKGRIVVEEPVSGRKMTIETNQPGMVLYTSTNMEEGFMLRGGGSQKYAGLCFETQGSPTSLHHDAIPSILLHAGEMYDKKTVFTFG